MELISRHDVVNLICDSRDLKELFDRVYDEIPTIKLVYCQDCKNLKHREDLEDNIKRRLPDNLIGHCWRTGVYVRENDYCCGGEE